MKLLFRQIANKYYKFNFHSAEQKVLMLEPLDNQNVLGFLVARTPVSKHNKNSILFGMTQMNP